jgi:hypothetical protein
MSGSGILTIMANPSPGATARIRGGRIHASAASFGRPDSEAAESRSGLDATMPALLAGPGLRTDRLRVGLALPEIADISAFWLFHFI